MPGRLEGKVAIVTGGAGGFGKAITAQFVQEGAKVVIADFAEEAGKATASELGAHYTKCDVTSAASWESVKKVTLDTYGQIDIVVNNAGTTYHNKPTETCTEDDYNKVMNVNVKSIFLSTTALVPYFLEKSRPGCFITISSTAGVRPRPGLTWYNASKAAASNATKTMAVEYGPKGIRFNAICPVIASGTGLTSLFIGKEDTADNMKAFQSVIPMGRGCKPSDVAGACTYLASEDACFVTGVNLEVDGGRCV